jgi:hypothetical protein
LRKSPLALSLGLLLVSSPAWAYVWFGNPPDVRIEIDRLEHDLVAATATVDAVRMHACGGGYTDYGVGQTLDLTSPVTLTVGTGAWCGASVVWGSAVTVTNGTWTVVYDDPYTSVAIDADPDTTAQPLTPFDVTSGTFSGYAPRLVLSIAD